MLAARVRRLVRRRRSSRQSLPADADAPIFGATPAAADRPRARRSLSGMVAVARPRLAVDQRPGRPDHQRHDHQHRGARPDRLPQHAHLASSSPAGAGSFTPFDAARRGSTDLPLVGWLFDDVPAPGPDHDVGRSSSSIVLQILLFRSRWGLRTRAVGEHPKAAETVGIDVIRLRYRNVILGGRLRRRSPAPVPARWRQQLVPGRDDRRPRVHRAGGDDLRPLDAARRVRRGAAVRRPRRRSADRHQVRAAAPASWATILTVDPGAVLRRAALPRDDRRPGRRRRPQHPAGRRRPAVRARGRDLSDRDGRPTSARAPRTSSTSRRAADPVPVLDDAGDRASCSARPAGSRSSGASPNPGRPSYGVMRYLLDAGLRVRAGQPERARGPRRAGLRDARGGGRRDRAVRHRRRLPALRAVRPARARGGRGRRPLRSGSSSASSTGRRPRIAHDGGPARRHGPLHGDRAAPDRRPPAGRRPTPQRIEEADEDAARRRRSRSRRPIRAWRRRICHRDRGARSCRRRGRRRATPRSGRRSRPGP